MSAIDTALRFTAAWLAVGFGLFVAARSLTAVPRERPATAALLAALGVLSIALALLGIATVVRVVPW